MALQCRCKGGAAITDRCGRRDIGQRCAAAQRHDRGGYAGIAPFVHAWLPLNAFCPTMIAPNGPASRPKAGGTINVSSAARSSPAR